MQPLVNDYTERINRVLDYIEANLDKQFTLEELAAIANFSRFHFSRIFSAMVGETPFGFIARIRLEKAASLLKQRPDEPVLQIAMTCGYSDKSVFSRSFKSHFSLSPAAYRKADIPNRNNSQQNRIGAGYFRVETNTKIMELIKEVAVKTLPLTTVAYIRHTGPYQGDGQLFMRLFGQIHAWAKARNLVQPDTNTIAIYHDDPCVTEAQKLRLSIGVNVPADTNVEGEVGKLELEGGKYAVATFELLPPEFPEAWSWLFGTWFPGSGYQPDDQLCFELYPFQQPQNGKIAVHICVPVKPL